MGSNVPVKTHLLPKLTDQTSSQGGVFTRNKAQPMVRNTPLGIQPKQSVSQNKSVTTREEIIQRRREMQSKLRNNPVWKI